MKCEILAPAGTPEAFVAACEAGADAVYAGVSSFNARQRARNFTLREFAALVDYAHSMNVRVYATFNTLVKQGELPEALKAAGDIVSAGVDAFIVQDLGVVRMMRSCFPGVPLHASTQMAVHNSAGVRSLERRGFDRVVLARELSFDEIAAVSGGTRAELEIFVHGALCFSMSGLCLASSCMGGCSGNRGLCAQPCRRKWVNHGFGRYFFSPCDLDASSFAEGLGRLGIASLKIEGRMKSSEYVARTVRYWRNLMDSRPLPEAEDFSRRKTDYYLSGMKGRIINSGGSPCVGLYAGVISGAEGGRAFVDRAEEKVMSGDSVRIIGRGDEEIASLSLRGLSVDGCDSESADKGSSFSFLCPDASKGMRLFVSGRPMDFLEGLKGRVSRILKTARPFGAKSNMLSNKKTRGLFPELGGRGKTGKKNFRTYIPLYLKLPSVDCVGLLGGFRPDFLMLPFDFEMTPDDLKKRLGGWCRDRVVLCLDPFVPEGDVAVTTESARAYFRAGFRNWQASNVSHFEMIPKGASVSAGPFLYALNSMSLRQLAEFGVRLSFSSYEDDYLNLRDRMAFAEVPTVVTVFAYVPVFTSRITSPHFFADGERLSCGSFSVTVRRRRNCMAAVADRPFSVLQSVKRLLAFSPGGFFVDLGLAPEDGDLFGRVLDAYLSESPFPGSDKYNFKRGLK